MGLEKEIWKKTIEEKLLQDNSFLNHISDVSEDNIVNGKIVHIPQAGEPSKVVKNRTIFPAEVKRRNDGEVLYKIDEYSTDPVYISNAETVELSYDKRRSVLDRDVENLSEDVAEGMLMNMVVSPIGDNKTLPQKNILETTGAATSVLLEGATGNRKKWTILDLQKMQNLMRTQKAWQEGQMFALLPANAILDIFPADSPVTATYMQMVTEEERRNGIIYKVQGFNILIRSSVFTMTESKEFKGFGSVVNNSDSEAAIFWNKNMVEKAYGDIETFDRERDPQYYGDIYSFLVRMGGRAKRKDFEGVAVLKQANA
ncbi:hypothetical protein OKE68_08450 [Riemerella anatipestifer]|uniref:Uncharacterized protein n=2 Tax=Pseudomonadati TaxID=3379134 RepID=A0A1A5HLV9_RIEAN|nr:hypothetical protein [Riemerella anatipestifer]AQY20997.1 hypothetical protein AB406_0031 [Riemerella anatipestifer]AZZ57558.1 hypothetical protein AWB57_00040 [Riemerella anatipestifer]AZZ57765.1 hypothetical protein AWB57_01160 [Riemerella anatipestifer]MBT0573854.1 hypothetical protein [Riemerella anatipestifer]MCU7567760.1 hypothetical protein [Riemerella anatipestifer]